jgi:hypothetical protein
VLFSWCYTYRGSLDIVRGALVVLSRLSSVSAEDSGILPPALPDIKVRRVAACPGTGSYTTPKPLAQAPSPSSIAPLHAGTDTLALPLSANVAATAGGRRMGRVGHAARSLHQPCPTPPPAPVS